MRRDIYGLAAFNRGDAEPVSDLLPELNRLFALLWQGDWLHQFQSPLHEWGAWSYLLLALLVAVEGPIATLVGAAAATGALHLPWVFVAASVGNLSADALWYGLGRSGRMENAVRYGRWIGLQEEQIHRLEAGVRQNATRILLVAKLTAGLVIPALIAAGLVRAPWRRWFLPVFAGEMIWTGVLVLGGYYATAYLVQIERGVTYAVAGGSLLVLLFLGYKARGLWKNRKHSVVPPGDTEQPAQPKRGKSV